jgi:hypothetical protein
MLRSLLSHILHFGDNFSDFHILESKSDSPDDTLESSGETNEKQETSAMPSFLRVRAMTGPVFYQKKCVSFKNKQSTPGSQCKLVNGL